MGDRENGATRRAPRRGSPRGLRRQVGKLWHKHGTTTGFPRHSDSNMLKDKMVSEESTRHADFQSVVADSRGLIINHLQHLPAPTPASPRHNHGTPNLSSTHSWHRASRSAANSQLALERYEISGKTERPLVDPERS
jgi:hypothetical protein